MSNVRDLFIVGGIAAAAGAIAGGVIGGIKGREMGHDDAKEAMKYLDITEVTEEIRKTQKSFEDYADAIGKKLGEEIGDDLGKEFAKKLKSACFLNYDQTQQLGQMSLAKVPLLRETDISTNSYLGTGSEKSTLYNYFDAYYKTKKQDGLDKHVMIVRFLDNMTYMIMNNLKLMEQCPGDQYEKAIKVLEVAYDTLLHNFLVKEAKTRDVEFLNDFRDGIKTIFKSLIDVDIKTFELNKELLAADLQKGYTTRFQEAKATQKNLTVLNTAQKLKEELNKQATATHELILRSFSKIYIPPEPMALHTLSEGIADTGLRQNTQFDGDLIGKIIKNYAKNLFDFFPRVNEQNKTGRINRFNEHFEANRLDANIPSTVEKIILESKLTVNDSQKNLAINIAEILNSFNMAYALESDLLLDLESYGAVGMLATGELEFRQTNVQIFYDRAIQKLQNLVQSNLDSFLPYSSDAEWQNIPKDTKNFLNIDRNQVNKDKNLTLLNMMKEIDNNTRIYREEMTTKIESILKDQTIEKIPQFTLNSGSYMSEMAIICAHDEELSDKIISSTFPDDSQATKRVVEFKKESKKLQTIKFLYEDLINELNKLPPINQQNNLEIELHKIISTFKYSLNFNKFTTDFNITEQMKKVSFFFTDLQNVHPELADNEVNSKNSLFIRSTQDIYNKLTNLYQKINAYQGTQYETNEDITKQYNETLTSISQSNTELLSNANTASTTIKTLEANNNEMTQQIKSLEDSCNTIKEQLNKALEQQENLNEKLNSMEENSKKRDNVISKFTTEFTKIYQQQFQRQLDDLNRITEEINSLKANTMDENYKKSLLDRLQTIKNNMENDYALIDKLYKDYEKELLEINKSDLDILVDAKSIVKELESTLNLAKDTVKSLKQKVDALQEVVVKQSKEISDLKNQNQAIVSQLIEQQKKNTGRYR